MSIPPEALQKVLQEIEMRVMQSQLELTNVRQQISQKQRDIRLTDLTMKELKDIPPSVGVWEGVGKMFLNVPIATHVARLEKEKSESEDQLGALNKKLNYLETTYKNAKRNIDDILGHAQ
ncbi:Prefoldin [Lipomyces orientalis]|uniref:Prefoldin n=1 Tax=Lipomyces orientalis TaxID=1233043 RepID=A0ACC3TYM9_9ASCO